MTLGAPIKLLGCDLNVKGPRQNERGTDGGQQHLTLVTSRRETGTTSYSRADAAPGRPVELFKGYTDKLVLLPRNTVIFLRHNRFLIVDADTEKELFLYFIMILCYIYAFKAKSNSLFLPIPTFSLSFFLGGCRFLIFN